MSQKKNERKRRGRSNEKAKMFHVLVNLLRILESKEVAHVDFWEKKEKFHFLHVIFFFYFSP